MFLCIKINESLKCKSAHGCGKNRKKQHWERAMTASLFTKLDR